MDAINVEAYSFVRQQFMHRIYYESNRQGLQLLSLGVVDAMVQFFYQGVPVWNYSFCTLVIRLALSFHIAQIQGKPLVVLSSGLSTNK